MKTLEPDCREHPLLAASSPSARVCPFLDSSDRGHSPEKFAHVFARRRELGLQLVAHAREEGLPTHIERALDVLPVDRIGPGVCCLEALALPGLTANPAYILARNGFAASLSPAADETCSMQALDSVFGR